MLKRWVPQSFSGLVWSVSTPRKIKPFYFAVCISLLFCLLPFGINTVHATDTPTPTPTVTPTWEPIFNPQATATPRDMSCPTQQPVGAGTVTPDPLWLSKCGQCIRRTPQSTLLSGNPLATLNAPTRTPSGPTPTGPTPTSAATMTPTPAAGTPRYYVVQSVGAHSWTNGSSKSIHWFEQSEMDSVCFSDLGGVRDIATALYLNPAASNSIDYYAMINNSNTRTIWQWVPGGYTGNQQRWLLFEKGKPAQYWVPYFGNVAYQNARDLDNANRRFGSEVDPNKTQSYAGMTLCYGDGIDPAADSGKYCGSVQGISGGDSTGGIGIGLPDIRISPSTCYDVGGQTVDLSFMSALEPLTGWSIPDGFTIPGFRVCFRMIAFGAVNLFGLQISITSIALAIAGIWLFKSLLEEG